MTQNLKTPQARLLSRVMCDLSEEYMCAQWPVGNEYKLWADLTGEEVNGWRGWGISPEERDELRLVHELAGGRLVWSTEAKDIVFLSTAAWLDHVASVAV